MKNIKVITGVIATLGIFSALLLVTGILFLFRRQQRSAEFPECERTELPNNRNWAAVFRH
ncbi:methyl-accepting chemotaxis citrate transducer [Salmonella sp. NCTC 11881]|nr:methyl-accepting chemotaxis citrate transducer [Salmonella sp. NCTC 11881]